jgi:hypothetical protein
MWLLVFERETVLFLRGLVYGFALAGMVLFAQASLSVEEVAIWTEVVGFVVILVSFEFLWRGDELV